MNGKSDDTHGANGANGHEEQSLLRAAVGKGLVSRAVDAPNGTGDDTEDGEIERVTIRSLDEEVAVGGKNFST